ncbi:g3403 [Coccomyxa elongata]
MEDPKDTGQPTESYGEPSTTRQGTVYSTAGEATQASGDSIGIAEQETTSREELAGQERGEISSHPLQQAALPPQEMSLPFNQTGLSMGLPGAPEPGVIGWRKPLKLKWTEDYQGEGGETLENWVFHIEERMAYCSVLDDLPKIRYAALHFKGRALLWWRNLKERARLLGEPEPITWAAFKQALRREFQPVSLERLARAKLDAARQTATVAGFVDELRRLKWDIPGLSDSELRYRFEKGLSSPAIADAVTARPDLPIEDAFRLAITIDANRDARKDAYKGGRSGVSGRQAFNRLEVFSMEQKETRTCYRCGKIGHLSRNCSMPPDPNRGDRGGRGRGGGRRGRGRGYRGRGNGAGQSA